MSWLLSPEAGTIDLGDLQDITITSIASNELLQWNGSAWINQTIAELGLSAVGHLHDSITDTNLVDKSAAESIGGVWSFNAWTTDFNRLDNNTTFMRIGEPTTARGNSQDAALQMFGENAGTIYGFSMSVYSSNMSWGGTGSNPVTALQMSLQFQHLSGKYSAWYSPDNSRNVQFIHGATDLAITGTDSQDINVTGIGSLNVPALASSGAVTGSNLSVSNWDTAFGWGDHSTAGYGTMNDLVDDTTPTLGGNLDPGLFGFSDTLLVNKVGIPAFHMENTDVLRYALTAFDTNLSHDIDGQSSQYMITWNRGVNKMAMLQESTGLTIYESGAADTDYIRIEMDGTDVNFTHNNVTDWNITGVTAIQAGTVDLDVDALTATSYGGIVEASLVDKSAAEVITGHWAIPSTVNTQNGNYTLVLGDAEKTIHKVSGASGETITIPANASVAFPIGTLVCIQNDGGGTLTIAITTDTLTWAEDNTTGSRVLADGGALVIQKMTATTWKCAGSQVT